MSTEPTRKVSLLTKENHDVHCFLFLAFSLKDWTHFLISEQDIFIIFDCFLETAINQSFINGGKHFVLFGQTVSDSDHYFSIVIILLFFTN